MSWATDNQCLQIWWWSPWENKRLVCSVVDLQGSPKLFATIVYIVSWRKGLVLLIYVPHNSQLWKRTLIRLSSKSRKSTPTIYKKEKMLLPYLQNTDTYVLCSRRLVVLRHRVHSRDLKKYKWWSTGCPKKMYF